MLSHEKSEITIGKAELVSCLQERLAAVEKNLHKIHLIFVQTLGSSSPRWTIQIREICVT